MPEGAPGLTRPTVAWWIGGSLVVIVAGDLVILDQRIVAALVLLAGSTVALVWVVREFVEDGGQISAHVGVTEDGFADLMAESDIPTGRDGGLYARLAAGAEPPVGSGPEVPPTVLAAVDGPHGWMPLAASVDVRAETHFLDVHQQVSRDWAAEMVECCGVLQRLRDPA